MAEEINKFYSFSFSCEFLSGFVSAIFFRYSERNAIPDTHDTPEVMCRMMDVTTLRAVHIWRTMNE